LPVGCGGLRRRIVNRILQDRTPQRVAVRRGGGAKVSPCQCGSEIAVAIGGGGNGNRLRVDLLRFAVLLKVEEEERLVVSVVDFWNPDRAAYSEAIVVAPCDR